MITVDVSVATRKFTIDRALLARAAGAALAGRIAEATVSVSVFGSAQMRRLNKLTLGHDYITDVLSTDHGDTPEGRLLEVFICAPLAVTNARKHGVPFKQELARYVIHGCLHCAGFDDVTDKQRDAMWTEQERLMRRLVATAYVPATPDS